MMPRNKKTEENNDHTERNSLCEKNTTNSSNEAQNTIPKTTDIEWTDYVLGLLSDDEKISGNPTTDGLRRVFEIALNCTVVESTSSVVQTPDINNEKRATVVHTVGYYLNNAGGEPNRLNIKTVSGAADVYWGNCDKIFRNHPVAVAETRAEGRALRRALKLRKVVAAEEIAKDIEDNPDHDTVTKITNNQINFIDVLSKRLNVDCLKLIKQLAPKAANVYNIEYEDAVNIVKNLTTFQQTNTIPEDLLGYNSDWK
jgi:hypothetical protein